MKMSANQIIAPGRRLRRIGDLNNMVQAGAKVG